MTISNPKYLTKQIHNEVLTALRKALNLMKAEKKLPENMKNLRIRNWLFIYEDGVPTVDIIIDKGYDPNSLNQEPPRQANTSLSFDECAEIHQFILSTDALDTITDEVSVRVGSPGSEPTLHDIEDFEASIGDMVRIETWVPKEERTKFTMILVDIFEKEGNSIAVVAEGVKNYEIPLDDIKTAFVLPFHPASKSMKKTKKALSKNKK